MPPPRVRIPASPPEPSKGTFSAFSPCFSSTSPLVDTSRFCPPPSMLVVRSPPSRAPLSAPRGFSRRRAIIRSRPPRGVCLGRCAQVGHRGQGCRRAEEFANDAATSDGFGCGGSSAVGLPAFPAFRPRLFPLVNGRLSFCRFRHGAPLADIAAPMRFGSASPHVRASSAGGGRPDRKTLTCAEGLIMPLTLKTYSPGPGATPSPPPAAGSTPTGRAP